MSYEHLNEEERNRLAVLRGEGHSLRAISRVLGRSPGTLCREIQRNTHKPRWGAKRYYAHTAHRKACYRLRTSHQRERLKSAALRLEVVRLVQQRWSPELIAGRLKRTRPELPQISPEAIYQWIYTYRRDLIQHLARSHRKRFPQTIRFEAPAPDSCTDGATGSPARSSKP